MTALDLVAARARHAAWLSARRPAFTAPGQTGSVCLPGALHPLLLEAALPSLPEPPSAEAAAFDNSYMEPVQPVSPLNAVSSNSKASTPVARRPPPTTIDLTVPPGKAVVTVTGPNTGTSMTAGRLTAVCPGGRRMKRRS